ncbi:unnamed protein product [Protopolystoma xenopodis]|uniref:Uncharacterized protein n=1 Tax=Protopolystoma xenopodis TaxID=117903 RepID=A0A3S5C3J2_9PLAT|nr:unnamed protein product [Protopolystoma xenopodis]
MVPHWATTVEHQHEGRDFSIKDLPHGLWVCMRWTFGWVRKMMDTEEKGGGGACGRGLGNTHRPTQSGQQTRVNIVKSTVQPWLRSMHFRAFVYLLVGQMVSWSVGRLVGRSVGSSVEPSDQGPLDRHRWTAPRLICHGVWYEGIDHVVYGAEIHAGHGLSFHPVLLICLEQKIIKSSSHDEVIQMACQKATACLFIRNENGASLSDPAEQDESTTTYKPDAGS